MDMNHYQHKALATAVYPMTANIVYPTLGLVGEAGEVAEKVKKLIRRGVDPREMADEDRLEIAKELGDVLWYLANVACDLGYSLEQIAEMNIEKLESRAARGVLEGNGDNR